MTKAKIASVREISRDSVMKQLEHLGGSSISKKEVNRAIAKVSKVLLEVKEAQEVK